MLRVLYILNIPSPYRISYLEELSKYCKLTVIFERVSAADRNAKWNKNNSMPFNAIFLNGHNWNNDSTVSFKIKKYLNDDYDYVVFCNFLTPTGIIGINYCIKNNIDYCIEADGAFYRKNFFKDLIKKKIVKRAKICFSTCRNLDNYYRKLGVDKKSVARYKFTPLTKQDISNNSKRVVKENFNKYKDGKTNILFVGQFIKRKGIDVLLKACGRLTKDERMLLVGGILNNDLKDLLDKAVCDVEIIDFKTKEELYDYYSVSDIFVLPTREDIWGLVVNEALSFGIPVITTRNCNAGLELIRDDYNGFLFDSEDYITLADKILKLVALKNTLKENCLNTIKEYTIENMVKDHLIAFEENEKKSCHNK